MSSVLFSIVSIAQVILINVVLSGDNALVVALAARHLPVELRRRAMYWGVGLAVSFQLILTLIVSWLLLIPGLQLVGAILLAGIACRLLQEEAHSSEEETEAPTTLRSAVMRIALADLVMSLDNVLAVAGVTRSDSIQLLLGLAISVAIILACSSVIMSLMNRFSWIAYLGTAILSLTAAGMISHDLVQIRQGSTSPHQPNGFSPWLDWSFRLAFVGLCLSSSRWWPAFRSIRWSAPLARRRAAADLEPAVEVQASV